MAQLQSTSVTGTLNVSQQTTLAGVSGTVAQFTTVSASNLDILSGNVILSQTDISLGDNAYIDYNSSIDKLTIFPGLYITGALTASTSVSASNIAATSAVFTVLTGSTVTGSTALFTIVTGSTVTGSTARFTTVTGSTVTGSTALFTSVTASFTGSGAGLTSIPNGALVNSSITVGSTNISLGATATTIQGLSVLTGSIITGSSALFTTVTSSFSGSGANITNITASNIVNFTNDVRAQFSAGTNITINNGVISASGGGGTPGDGEFAVQFNSGSTFSGSQSLIYNYNTNILSGTTAQFTTITGSTVTGSTGIFNSITGSSINLTGTLSASSAQAIIQSDQGISFRTKVGGTGSFTERMFIGTNDFINTYSSINATAITASVLTANVITSSVTLTGSTALFTTITGSTVTGTTMLAATYQAGAGSVAAVSYGFGAVGVDTGIFRPAANTVGFSTNGAERMRLTTTSLFFTASLTGGVLTGSSIYGHTTELNNQTAANYSLQGTDGSALVNMSSSAANTVTVPTGLPIGYTVNICQMGTGQTTISASVGVTIYNRQSHTKTAGQFAVVLLRGTALNTYVLSGDTAA